MLWNTCSILCPQQLYKLAVWGYLVQFVMGTPMIKRETRCPVFWDSEWQRRDQQCEDKKKYHCFEDENGSVVADGCYQRKLCLIGARPKVEGTSIICSYCQKGFQPQANLSSNTYTFSYCQSHSRPCMPEYGESQCRAGTREVDRACTCNATLGFSPWKDPDNCQCFTVSDPCSGCQFTGCLPGYIKIDQEYCVPDQSPISTAPTTQRPMSTSFSSLGTTPVSSDDSVGKPATIAAVVISVLTVISIGFLYWKRKWLQKCSKKIQQQDYASSTNVENNQELPETEPVEEKELMLVQNRTYNIEAYSVVIQADSPTVDISGVVGQVSVGSREKHVFVKHASEYDGCTSGHPPDLPVSLSDPSAPPLSLPDPSAPPPSLLDPSAPLPLPDPSALPSSLPEPSAPPPSLPEPSAPPPSLPDPSAPPLSLPDPSAPPLSLPATDQTEEERDTDTASGDTDETSAKTRWQSDDEETLRKVAVSNQDGETGVKTHLLADVDQGKVCREETNTVPKLLPLDHQEMGVESIMDICRRPFPQEMNTDSHIHRKEDTDLKTVSTNRGGKCII